MDDNVVLVPLQLQAFVLNDQVCNTGEADDKGARIIPITQPNYTFLRLDNFLIQSDVLNHADLHNAAPASTNTRLTDLGARPEPRERRNRYGVYLHWILPRTYRSGIVAADSVSEERHEKERERLGLAPREPGRERRGGGSSNPSVENTETPEYLSPPTRWIIIRRLHMNSIAEGLRTYFSEYDAWVLESDYQWDLSNIPTNYDLQVDVSPYVVGQQGDGVDIMQQAEVFIGRKTPLAEYQPAAAEHYADIGLLKSGNSFFADYQLHNSNVFSLVDNFEYFESTEEKEAVKLKASGSGKYLDKASADYYLVGWHASDDADPLWNDTGKFTHADKLKAIFMDLRDTGISETKDFLNSSSPPARLCLHGALYDVHWDKAGKPESPADRFSAMMQDQDMPAAAVGTSPMDALVSYLTARKGRHNKDRDRELEKLEEDIIAIDSLLHARDDGIEGQREAKDMVYNWNFSRSQGGKHFFLAGEDTRGKPTKPDPDSQALLNNLNRYQRVLDACRRSLQQYRWDMFSLWWKYVTDVTNKDDATANGRYKRQTDDVSKKLRQLEKRVKELEKYINDVIDKNQNEAKSGLLQSLKSSTLPVYFRARDPTMLVGGVESGWPSDFNDNVNVRLERQCVSKNAAPNETDGLTRLADITESITDKFKSEKFLSVVGTLLKEFWTLTPTRTGDDEAADPGHAFPQFHDRTSATMDNKFWRDRWENRQPWFPLFAEWEVEYTHVPFEWWELSDQAARLSAPPKTRYGVPAKDDQPLWKKMQTGDPKKALDTRILSGRVLILPQPSFSLAAKVNQLFSDTPPKLFPPEFNDVARQNLLDNLSRLSYLSCPLNGLTEGLLTVSAGAHIKPENKFITEDGIVSTVALEAARFDAAGLTSDNINLIANNSGFTPYSSQNDYSTSSFCPFKPVTHGQFRFTKFNIIDKFGQAIVAIDPKPRKGPRQHPPFYPAISDFYEPQLVRVNGQDMANTVLPNEPGKCEFVQLPPQINQNSRLNTEFVVRQKREETEDDKEDKAPTPYSEDDIKPPEAGNGSYNPSYWRPVHEWENPIWGWLVVNYADQGIQIFLADGTFYREVRIGGRDGALVEPKWLPFAHDPQLPQNEQNVQLNELINKMSADNGEYLRGLWVMISTAIKSMPPSPSAYSQFLGSIVGKPLALVNIGLSLELEGPAHVIQSTKTSIHSEKPERFLLPQDPPEEDKTYALQVKLGDKGREYDGLVGYFDTVESPNESHHDKELLLDQINTYFVNENESEATHPPEGITNLKPIKNSSYPTLKPYWVPPFPHKGVDYEDRKTWVTPQQYEDRRNSKLKVYGAIVDPFTPIHAFSSFLPAASLQLPPWTWQDAMTNITAFFHAGPISITHDVGTFDKDGVLTTDKMKEDPTRNVAFPSLGGGDWNWLQPYNLDQDMPQPFHQDQGLPQFNAYGIETKGDIMSPGFEKAPYTAVEGFLQLRRPIMTDKPEDDTKK